MKRKNSKLSNETSQERKFVSVTINDINIELEFDTRSDITIINEKTWEKLSKHSLLTSRKDARGVSGRKWKFLYEIASNISFVGKNNNSGACVIKQNEFIWNGWYCLIQSLGPANQFVL